MGTYLSVHVDAVDSGMLIDVTTRPVVVAIRCSATVSTVETVHCEAVTVDASLRSPETNLHLSAEAAADLRDQLAALLGEYERREEVAA